MAKKTKQEAQQERLSLAEKRNRQERRNKKSRKEREQEKRRKKQERDRRKQKSIPTTAQQSIPYIRMLQDGICQVTKTFFSKTIQFYDINYQLALNEDKTTIFENYCDFLNYFDSSISVQLSFINQQVDVAEFEKSIDIPDQNDDFNAIREEYRTMLKNQLSKGNNGLVKTKYITFGIEAESLKVARPRLERIETDILNNFKVLGAQAHSLNGLERLEILYHVFNQDRIEPFKFQYKMLPETGLKTKDFIAPTSFNFSKNQTFLMGRTMGSVSYLQILAPELTDRMLADFLDVDDSINVNIHIQSIDQSSAIKMIKSKISDLDKMKIEEQKRAVRSGYDMDVLPSDLVTYGEEAKNLLEDLQSRNERMFLVTVLVMNTAKKRQKLDNNIFQVQGIAQKYNCSLKQLSEVEGILFYGWSEGVRVCTTLVSDFPNAQALILQSGIAEGWSSYFSYILRELTVEKLKELDNNNDSILEISDFLNCIPDSTSISFSLYLLILGTDKEGNMKFNEELDPEGKGRFSIIDNWIPLADEIVADPTTLIRFAENAPGETWAGILDDIKKIQLPILVLHGLNDGWISPVEAVQIAKAARNNADIILFKGLGHSLSKVSSPLKDEGGTIEDEVIVRVVEWLKKNVE